MSAGQIIRGRDQQGDLELRAQVCVVGSGAGGAVVAKTLAEAGLDVVILEEGGHTPPEVYGKYRPTETLRNLAREGGTSAALPLGDTPVIGILAGRTVGGSSVLTGGVCFRIPESITDHWAKDLGLAGFDQHALEPCYEDVEREVHVETVPESMRSRSTVLFGQGSAKQGFPLKPLRRNTKDCNGCGRCNFGCPHQAKLSVDLTYLRKAVAAGARIYADCRVDRVLTENGRAVGVVGHRISEAPIKPLGKFTVRAETTIICAGTMHTPLILLRSGVGKRSGAVGRRLTLHPTFRVAAYFDQEVRGWEGALQSAYSDHYEHEGLTFISAFPPVSVIAGGLPGVGAAHHARLREVGKLAMFGGMIHDVGGGTIRRDPFSHEPFVTYRMDKRDKERMFRGIRIAAEAFFAAGAKEILLPTFGVEGIVTPDHLKILDPKKIPARNVECTAFHPLGSARMGTAGTHGVVDAFGHAFDLEGLYVADGSLFPTSIGVNSQLPIMTVATKIAWRLRETLTAGRVAPTSAVVA